ncbi:MAG TPA: pyridoxal phosphate-dependent aminotransferase [Acidimicrobiales bacterium]
MTGARGWTPPPYPYDRLGPMKEKADALEGGAVDLSIGTPCDAPPPAVTNAMGAADARGYPPSIGTPELRAAAVEWMQRRLGVDVPPSSVAACVGTKEFVASVPQYLKLRAPDRDTVLYPAVSYPTYEMGATLAGLRAVAVPMTGEFLLDLDAISDEDASRALVLWVNSPGNPAGQLDDLGAAAAWGRAHGVPVFSDECYVEFTWSGAPQTILQHGLDGVVAVHSLSKRSNLAGARVGFYAGDGDLVGYLKEVRKHAGFLVPAPMQAAATVALGDDEHVDVQRERYAERLRLFQRVLSSLGVDAPMPGGAFYLWARAPEGDAWGFAAHLAAAGGVLVAPGDTFGPQGAEWFRAAMVQPLDRLELVADRLGG